MKTRKLYLWSYRWTVAQGWHWTREREVSLQTSHRWLDIFQKDDPQTAFMIRANRPQL